MSNPKPMMEEQEEARWLCFIEALDVIYDRMDELDIEELDLDTPQKHDRAYRGICKYMKERYIAMLEDLRTYNRKKYGWLL